MTSKDQLQQMIQTCGTLNWIKFDEIAGDVLKEHHGYTDEDLADMSVGDVKERIEELYSVEFEDDGDFIMVKEH